jgi:hypothetical protein
VRSIDIVTALGEGVRQGGNDAKESCRTGCTDDSLVRRYTAYARAEDRALLGSNSSAAASADWRGGNAVPASVPVCRYAINPGVAGACVREDLMDLLNGRNQLG